MRFKGQQAASPQAEGSCWEVKRYSDERPGSLRNKIGERPSHRLGNIAVTKKRKRVAGCRQLEAADLMCRSKIQIGRSPATLSNVRAASIAKKKLLCCGFFDYRAVRAHRENVRGWKQTRQAWSRGQTRGGLRFLGQRKLRLRAYSENVLANSNSQTKCPGTAARLDFVRESSIPCCLKSRPSSRAGATRR